MCGIVGLVQREAVSSELLDEAARQLWRRGPDDAGVWSENGAGLGHRRLSVIDPSSAGHQPMVSPDGRYVIVFNGEIYNHMEVREELGNDGWKGHSDTETVLIAFARWGSNCLGKFHGMFAFAIWDRREKRLFAARDRMGEKPFYAILPAKWVFPGSTVRVRGGEEVAAGTFSVVKGRCSGYKRLLEFSGN